MTDLLAHYRALALAAVPEAEDGMSYGMPALRYRGRPLISVMALKKGYGVYPFSPAVVEIAVAALEGFTSTKGGITFTAERPLPDAVFEILVTERKAEIDAALGAAKR